MLAKSTVLGVSITNATEQKILEYLFTTLLQSSAKHYIVTPNPEMIVYAADHPDFKATLNGAAIALCDGIGLYWAARVLGEPVEERITGADFMESVCRESIDKPISIGLLGGKAGVAERARDRLVEKYPHVHIVFAASEWPGERSEYRVSSIKGNARGRNILSTHYSIHDTPIDILFVAFGHPKQEEWIAANLKNLPVKVAMGVGGAFDYLSGEVPRAPKLVRALGLEWLFRLVRQPWRWRRQVGLLKFVWLVIKEKFKHPPKSYS